MTITSARTRAILLIIAVAIGPYTLGGVSITPWPRNAYTMQQADLPFTEGDYVYFALQMESSQCGLAGGNLWFKEPNGTIHLVSDGLPPFGAQDAPGTSCSEVYIDAPPYHASIAHASHFNTSNGYWYLNVSAKYEHPNIQSNQWIDYGIPCGPTVRQDLNYDGVVDMGDIITLIGVWGMVGFHIADINTDGMVEMKDVLDVIRHWGEIS